MRGRRRRAWLVACWIVLVFTGCMPLGRLSTEPTRAACIPRFEDRDGWLGGDAAFSIEIGALLPGTPDDEQRSLWLFGDSFVARGDAPPRRRYPLIHNTVGLSRCDAAGRWSIDHAWRARDGGVPRAFFVPDPEAVWVRRATAEADARPYYWPFAGFVDGEAIFVALLRVVRSEPRGRFALPFRILGVDLARLVPTNDDPRAWPLSIRPVSERADLVPAAAFAVEGGYVHAFAFLNRSSDRHPRALVRWPRAALADGSPGLPGVIETWTRDGAWRAGLRVDEAAIVIDDDATEMSVHRDAETGRWIAVESGASLDGGGLRWRSAERLEGPWSAPRTLLAFPTRDPSRPSDDHVFCYAGKAHPQYATPASLVVTYVCNLFAPTPEHVAETLARLLERRDLYRPVAVRVPFSLPSAQPSGPGPASTP